MTLNCRYLSNYIPDHNIMFASYGVQVLFLLFTGHEFDAIQSDNSYTMKILKNHILCVKNQF